MQEVLDRHLKTELEAFFDYRRNPPEANVPYVNFPEQYVFNKGAWKGRQRGTSTIGRVYNNHKSKQE